MSGVENIGGVTLVAGAVPTSTDQVETLMVAIGTDRTNVLNAAAQTHATAMQERNAQLAELNKALNDLRAHSPHKDDADQQITGVSQETKDILAKYGVNYSDYVRTQPAQVFPPSPAGDFLKKNSGWGTLLEAVKTAIDNISSTSQLDMIKLQGVINKGNQSLEMVTNLMQKFSDTNSKIVSSIR